MGMRLEEGVREGRWLKTADHPVVQRNSGTIILRRKNK
ncbi:hypothetical protein A2U01_0107576, partial [Trifolium medium]|nr:hypothetical protein [Trifolium medium]